MDAVFYFHFHAHQDDKTPLRSLAFYIADLTFNTPRDWDELERKIARRAEEMTEKYGEHSGMYSGLSPTTFLLGLNSADVDEPHHNQVMRAWRSAFLHDFVGCKVSEVFDVTHAKEGAQMFDQVKQMYEHQQAQQLRETLNTHVSTGRSTALKKI